MKELCLFQKKSKRKAGDGLKHGKYPFYTSSQRVSKWVNEPDYDLSPSLIFGTGGLPSVHITSSKFSMSGDCLAITPVDAEKVDAKFIYFYLSGNIYLLEEGFKGAGLKHISKAYLENILIPLPPLETQKKIAAVLEKADQLRKDCLLMEQELNSLAQSVFIDMFGDPVTNPKGWDVKTLNDVCSDIYRYPTFYGFDYVDKGIPVVKIGNITADGYVGGDLSKYDFMPESISAEYPRTILKLGDIVMAVRGDGSTGKRIGLVESESVVNGNISPNLIMYRSNLNEVDPIFLYYFLTSNGGQRKIEKHITKTAKKTITGKDIKRIEIYCPPMKMQERFKAVYQEARSLQKSSSTTLDYNELFNTLMQKAFKGELNL